MAFLFPDKEPDELSDLEIVEDFLLTQYIIETYLRGLAENKKVTEYSKRCPKLPCKYLFGKELFDVLTETEPILFRISDKNYRCIFSDLSQAWVKFEHLERCYPIEECIQNGKFKDSCLSLHMRDKYVQYNRCVMPYYDFFMKLSGEERLEKLKGNKEQ